MDTAKQAVEVLTEAEDKLRRLVAGAATAGEYDAIQMVTDWARILGAMARESQQSDLKSGSATKESSAGSPHRNEHAQRASIAKGTYPRFFKRGDLLIKIGWSRNEKKEYEHNAPHSVVDFLAIAISRQSRNGRVFTAKDIFPMRVREGQNSSEVPIYQGYVALAWLKKTALVKQLGRRGYSVKKSLRLPEAVAAAWQKLPEITN